jgi:RNase H-like domain found in reverse transcriptase/Reverse transcriptase (RNA-dependent DNA polymerase)
MPNMEDESLSGSKYFSTLDLVQGYWQLPLHEDSQECQSILTPDGVYTPTRVQLGTTNATVHMQAIMEDLMHDIRHSVKIWLDDNMIHVTTEEKLLEVLEHFFKTCLQNGVFLHAAKCTLDGTEVPTADASSQQKACDTTREQCLRCNTWVLRRTEATWYSMWLLLTGCAAACRYLRRRLYHYKTY